MGKFAIRKKNKMKKKPQPNKKKKTKPKTQQQNTVVLFHTLLISKDKLQIVFECKLILETEMRVSK